METVIIASKNKNKIKEIEEILSTMQMKAISREDAEVPDFDVEETGKTFEENAFIKARAICEASGEITIADDSGLEVDFLSGRPGVYSARYAGPEQDDGKNNAKLLRELKDVPFENRTARFVCCIVMVYPDGDRVSVRGECKGHILEQIQGNSGFGYDPLFLPDGQSETFAQMSKEEKNRISHRADALGKLKAKLEERDLNTPSKQENYG